MNANYDSISAAVNVLGFLFNQAKLQNEPYLRPFLSSIGITVDVLADNRIGVKGLFECFNMSAPGRNITQEYCDYSARRAQNAVKF